MTDVEGRSPVVRRDIVLVHRKTVDAGGVAFGIVERIEAEERKLRSRANVEVRDQLVLIEETVGLVVVNVANLSQRPDAA